MEDNIRLDNIYKNKVESEMQDLRAQLKVLQD